MRPLLLFDFLCSRRFIDGQAPRCWRQRTARLSVRRSTLRGAGAWELLSNTERHVADSRDRDHASIEGPRGICRGISLRVTGRCGQVLSCSVAWAPAPRWFLWKGDAAPGLSIFWLLLHYINEFKKALRTHHTQYLSTALLICANIYEISGGGKCGQNAHGGAKSTWRLPPSSKSRRQTMAPRTSERTLSFSRCVQRTGSNDAASVQPRPAHYH